jgi:hypothetical protein
MIKRYEMPDGRLFDVYKNGSIWAQKTSENGAGTDWEPFLKSEELPWAVVMADILMRGKVTQTWE